ncbi:hypothetical protein [Caballeronia sp. ATUFL_M2_KS44]|nr:hypothetical protein [Caballeronia sp. ATUFL_M2_KS44]
MEAIVTQHPIVNWRKKALSMTDLQEKEEKHLSLKPISDGAMQQFSAL